MPASPLGAVESASPLVTSSVTIPGPGWGVVDQFSRPVPISAVVTALFAYAAYRLTLWLNERGVAAAIA